MFKKLKASTKIFILYFTIQIIIALILYPLLPTLLNYPPDSINNYFQKSLEGLTYTNQYILIVTIIILVSSIVLITQLHKINKYILSLKKNPSFSIMKKLRHLCIFTPFLIYYLEILAPLTLIPIALISVKALPLTIIKICIVYVSSFTLCAIISLVFSQKEFKKILVQLHNEYPSLINNTEINKKYKFLSHSLKKNLLLQFLPLIIAILTFTSLIAYVQSTKESGNIYNQSYKLFLSSSFNGKKINNINDIKQILYSIQLLDDTHFYFIIKNDSSYICNNDSSLSDFFVKYTIEKSESHDNRTYDYFCIDNEGSLLKLETLDGNIYWVGIAFSTTNYDLLIFLFITLSLLLIVTFIILFYTISSLVKDINRVTNNLEKITKITSFSKQLPITSNDEIKDLVVAFNNVQTMTQMNIKQIHDNQDLLIERERLATLGQMIGGIAHNLKTPIMSISGAVEGLTDLITEYNNSIEDPEVTFNDHHEIANDMTEWINKIRNHLSYMSDIISAVKGQAVSFSETQISDFTIEELIKQVQILMKHELNNSLITLNISVNVDKKLILHGNINSLVQVINNMISNSIQAYEGTPNQNIDLIINKNEKDIIISVRDYGHGMSKEVKDKLFKEMITTKGKNGTGLGLFMSHSNIRAHFNGNITFESEINKGTTFNIIIPL